MLGAILGDIIGSPYEFDFRNIKTTEFPLFSVRSEFTDDSVMTLAVAQALMETRGCAEEEICAALEKRMQEYFPGVTQLPGTKEGRETLESGFMI